MWWARSSTLSVARTLATTTLTRWRRLTRWRGRGPRHCRPCQRSANTWGSVLSAPCSTVWVDMTATTTLGHWKPCRCSAPRCTCATGGGARQRPTEPGRTNRPARPHANDPYPLRHRRPSMYATAPRGRAPSQATGQERTRRPATPPASDRRLRQSMSATVTGGRAPCPATGRGQQTHPRARPPANHRRHRRRRPPTSATMLRGSAPRQPNRWPPTKPRVRPLAPNRRIRRPCASRAAPTRGTRPCRPCPQHEITWRLRWWGRPCTPLAGGTATAPSAPSTRSTQAPECGRPTRRPCRHRAVH